MANRLIQLIAPGIALCLFFITGCSSNPAQPPKSCLLAQQYPDKWQALPGVLPEDAYQGDLCMQLMLVYGRGVYMGKDRQTHVLPGLSGQSPVTKPAVREGTNGSRGNPPEAQEVSGKPASKTPPPPEPVPRFIPNQEKPPEIEQEPEELPETETIIIDILGEDNEH